MQIDATGPQRGRFDISTADPSAKLWYDVYDVVEQPTLGPERNSLPIPSKATTAVGPAT